MYATTDRQTGTHMVPMVITIEAEVVEDASTGEEVAVDTITREMRTDTTTRETRPE